MTINPNIMNNPIILTVSALFIIMNFFGQEVHFVQNSNDSGEGSLRNLLTIAESHDTIKFIPEITIVKLTTDELTIDKSLAIIGDTSVTIYRDTIGMINKFRIIHIWGTNEIRVFFQNLRICHGKAPDGDINSNFSGGNGGGIYLGNQNSIVELDNCIIQNNQAGKGLTKPDNNGAAGGYGGGIFANNQSLILISCKVANNQGGKGGDGSGTYGYGGVGGYGGGVFCIHLKAINSYFNSNEAGSGGSEGSTSPYSIAGPGGDGGGIYGRYLEIINCEISQNKSGVGGGGYTGGQGGNGGGICSNTNSNCIIVNSSLCFNIANDAGNQNIPGSGGGIFKNSNSSIAIENSIISDNYAYDYGNDLYGSFNIYYSLVLDVEGCNINGENNIFEINPEFNNPPHDLSLSAISPAINNANPDTNGLNIPTLDLANNPRIVGSKIDMGAFEYQSLVHTDKIQLKRPIRIYPNPASDFLYLENAENSILHFFNLNGRLVKKYETANVREVIPINGLPSGIYMVQILRKGKSFNEKILIN